MNALLDRADLRDRVERVLSDFLSRQRAQLAEIDDELLPVAIELEAFVLGGGKRLRPAFAYWGYRGAGGADSDQVVATVTALELIQASALIHDDVIDSSDTRRGRPAIHRRFARRHQDARWHGDPEAFGAAAAILLGDLCLVWSDELFHAAGLPPAQLSRARPVLDRMRTEVTAGQYLDVLTQSNGDPTPATASKVARYKSAKYTVEHPLLLGAALADAGPEITASYTGYGLPLGEAFQLRDDVLGVFGEPSHTGKPAGDDLREGKRTFLMAAAFAAASPATQAALRAGLGDPELSPAGVARLQQIIVDTGALACTERRIAELTSTALAALGTAPLAPAAVEMLTELAVAATDRSR